MSNVRSDKLLLNIAGQESVTSAAYIGKAMGNGKNMNSGSDYFEIYL